MQKPLPKKILCLFAALLTLAGIAAGSAFLLNKLLHLDNYREQIITELQSSLNRKVSYGKGRFAFRPGPSLSFTEVSVLEKDGKSNLLVADHLTFKIALLPLFRKQILLKEVVLEKPQLFLSRDVSGAFSVDDLIESTGKDEGVLQIRGVRIKKGSVNFVDHGAGPERVALLYKNVDISLSNLMRGKKCLFKLSADADQPDRNGSISLSGSVKVATSGKSLAESTLTASIATENLDAARYWPYYSRFVPFKKILGQVEVDADFKGKLTEFSSKGTVKLKGLRFDYPQVFHAVLAPKDLRFKYDLQLDPDNVRVKSIDVSVDGVRLRGNCSVRDIRSGDIRITARATSSSIRFEDFHSYIPYGIIVPETADFIEQNIKGGIYTLDEGRLDGRISQIAHMENGNNYDVLAISAQVEKGILKYGRDVPPFHNVKGKLELRGKDFLLQGMSGMFGSSPLSLEGKITDYPLDKPSSYPFTLEMTPQQPEIAWLLGKDRGKSLSYSGESQLHLSGEGLTSGYNLSGEWNLTAASYSYPPLIAKPAGRSNAVSFRGSVNKEQAKVSTLQYTLAPMSLAITGAYNFGGKSNNLVLEIQTNQFQVSEVAQLLPVVAKYHPSGKVQSQVRGNSATGNFSDLSWTGNLKLAGAAVRIQQAMSPLSDINGTINFNGSSVETSQLAAKLGSSIIYGKGSMSSFEDPVISIVFSAPTLNMADLGLYAPQKEVVVSQVSGNVSTNGKDIHIKSLSGHLGKSSASIKGMVLDVSNPKIDVEISSSYMDLNDLLLIVALDKADKKGDLPGKTMSLKASIHAEAGQAMGVDFENLGTSLLLENSIAYIEPSKVSVFGGQLIAKGRVDAGTGGSPPRYQFNYDFQKVSVDKVAHALGMKKQEITGVLSLQGDLTGRGHTVADLKKSALGSIKFRCEHGSLRKLAVLSKVFSILNVSQLLKLKLPDMISGGMPYDHITASIAVKDGIVSCNDFYIASEAINMSAVGKIDLGRESIDATIGVQPLQTVDKVVNRIPVVGWILTGDKKYFLTTYFEAKGKLDDPVVRAIPVKGMAKGVLNIFMRVFQLPAKLITDTGEVLIGL